MLLSTVSESTCRVKLIYGKYEYKSWNANRIMRFEFRMDETFSFSEKSGMSRRSADGVFKQIDVNTFVLNTFYDSLSEHLMTISYSYLKDDTIQLLPKFRILYNGIVLKKTKR